MKTTHIFISDGRASPLPKIARAIQENPPPEINVKTVGSVEDLLEEISEIREGTCCRLDIIGHTGGGLIQLGHDDGTPGKNHYLGAPTASQLAQAIFGPPSKLAPNAELRLIGCFTRAHLLKLINALQKHKGCNGFVLKATTGAIRWEHYLPVADSQGAHPSSGPFSKGILEGFPC